MKKVIGQTIRFALLSLIHFSLHAQTPEEQIQSFFGEFEKGNIRNAVVNLYKSNDWMAMEKSQQENIILKFEQLGESEVVGDYIRSTFLKEEALSDFLFAYSYAILYDRQPLEIIFIFYKSESKWKLFSFTVDDRLDDYLKEKLKE